MKLHGIPDSGLRRIAQAQVLNVVEDPEKVFAVLTQLEGEWWAEGSSAEMSEYAWGGILQELGEVQEYARDEGLTDRESLRNISWVLYGNGGIARYRISGDGDIALDAGSVLPEKAEQAKSLGMKTY